METKATDELCLRWLPVSVLMTRHYLYCLRPSARSLRSSPTINQCTSGEAKVTGPDSHQWAEGIYRQGAWRDPCVCLSVCVCVYILLLNVCIFSVYANVFVCHIVLYAPIIACVCKNRMWCKCIQITFIYTHKCIFEYVCTTTTFLDCRPSNTPVKPQFYASFWGKTDHKGCLVCHLESAVNDSILSVIALARHWWYHLELLFRLAEVR